MRYYDANGTSHDVTIRDARKNGWMPSVTTIIGILANEGLNIWKTQQAIWSALTLTRNEGETDDEYLKRITQDSKEQSKNAAARGTEIHELIELYLNGIREERLPDKIKKWIDENIVEVVACEKVFVNSDIKCGCRIDLLALDSDRKMTLIDFKTTDLKGKKKPIAYDSWLYQLAGNSLCIAGHHEIEKYQNVVIDMNVDNFAEMHKVEWTAEEIENGWKVFIHCLEIFKIQKEI